MAGWLSKDRVVTSITKVQPNEPVGALPLTNWTMMDGGSGLTQTPSMIAIVAGNGVLAGRNYIEDAYDVKFSRVFRHAETVAGTRINVRFSATFQQNVSLGPHYLQVCDASAGDRASNPGLIESMFAQQFRFTWNGVSRMAFYGPGFDHDSPDFRWGIEILDDGFVRGYYYVQWEAITETFAAQVNYDLLLPIGDPVPYTPPAVSSLGMAIRLGDNGIARDLWIEEFEGAAGCPSSFINPVWPMPA